MSDSRTDDQLECTPLAQLHAELGARMVAFAGYAMPVQYPAGIIAEHIHTREKASLFDVSHMGQARLIGAEAAKALEALVPGDIQGLDVGRIRYTLLTLDDGGILDDLMVTRTEDGLFLVVNAACKHSDLAHIEAALPEGVRMERLDEDRALLALQGPAAAEVLGRFASGVRDLPFMGAGHFDLCGVEAFVTRSGYTGEDGFEISLANEDADTLARALLDADEVAPAGLGARDSLRLEAGLCLYGADIDETTTPVEAGLTWTIGKRRRAEGGFPGAERILRQIEDGPARKRVGIKPEGRAPARAHTPVQDETGRQIGELTSGGFGPSVGGPVAMGYVETAFAKPGTPLTLKVRGREVAASVIKLPFTPHRYAKS